VFNKSSSEVHYRALFDVVNIGSASEELSLNQGPQTTAAKIAAAKRLNVVGEQVRKIRLGLKPDATQEDLAGRLAACGFENLTRVLVNKIEAGKRTVIDVEILALAKALKVPVQRLFGK
jgi:hypothetical protein